jgi:hypothetical protein
MNTTALALLFVCKSTSVSNIVTEVYDNLAVVVRSEPSRTVGGGVSIPAYELFAGAGRREAGAVLSEPRGAFALTSDQLDKPAFTAQVLVKSQIAAGQYGDGWHAFTANCLAP